METAPADSMKKGRTAVDALETGYLAEKNLYLDVVRNVEDDCVSFGVRCDRELMDEGMVRAFAVEIAEEVEKIVRDFERDGEEKHTQEDENGMVDRMKGADWESM